MFIKKSSLGRAVLFTALVSFLSFGFISCQPETEIKYVDKEVEKLVEKEVEKLVEKNIEYVVPGAIYNLTENDPICGDFTGNMGDMFFHTDVAFATACSATNIADVTGKDENSYFTFSVLDWNTFDYVDTYFEKDSNPVYVIYNKFDDSEEADIHSGVIIFKAKYSPNGSPKTGCYYGVKFQFLEAEHKVPETRTKNTVYTNDLYIEGGYNGEDIEYDASYNITGYKEGGYNTVTDLATAVEMFAFDNTAYYSIGSWCWDYSGATRVTE
ncbi:MAG: hypothetical protein MJ185_06120 [Treponema sp.]|nr:hypothetical protein [Treponema sp.]